VPRGPVPQQHLLPTVCFLQPPQRCAPGTSHCPMCCGQCHTADTPELSCRLSALVESQLPQGCRAAGHGCVCPAAGRAQMRATDQPLVPYPDGASHELQDGASAEGSQSTVRTQGTGANAAVRAIPAHSNKHKHSMLVLR
jgi:hypothetical protein